MKRLLSSLFIILALISVTLYTATGTPSNLIVRTDANNYLLVTSVTQTNPVTQGIFSSRTLRTDSSGSLQVVLTGTVTPTYPQAIPASTCAAPSLGESGAATTGIAFTATPSILLCGLTIVNGTTSDTNTDLFIIKDSTGLPLFEIWDGSQVLIGGAGSPNSQTLLDIDNNTSGKWFDDPAGLMLGIQSIPVANLISGPKSTSFVGVWGSAEVGTTNTQDFTNTLVGVVGVVGTTRIRPSSGTISNAAAFAATNDTNSGGTVTNYYGLLIQDITRGVNDYGIYQLGADDINYLAGNLGVGVVNATASTLQIGNNYAYSLESKAWIRTAPSAPVACTTPTVTWHNGTATFQIDVGSSCAGVSTLSFTLPAVSNGYLCDAINTTTNTVYVTQTGAGTTTSVTLTNYGRTTGLAVDFVDGADIRIKCSGG